MTVELTAKQEHELALIASSEATTPQEVIADLVDQYLAEQAEHGEIIRQRRAEIAAGRTFDNDVVWSQLQARFKH